MIVVRSPIPVVESDHRRLSARSSRAFVQRSSNRNSFPHFVDLSESLINRPLFRQLRQSAGGEVVGEWVYGVVGGEFFYHGLHHGL